MSISLKKAASGPSGTSRGALGVALAAFAYYPQCVSALAAMMQTRRAYLSSDSSGSCNSGFCTICRDGTACAVSFAITWFLSLQRLVSLLDVAFLVPLALSDVCRHVCFLVDEFRQFNRGQAFTTSVVSTQTRDVCLKSVNACFSVRFCLMDAEPTCRNFKPCKVGRAPIQGRN